MELSRKAGRWVRILGVILVAIGILIVARALNQGAEIPINAYIAFAAGITAVIIARRSRGEEAGQGTD